jgi:hypothetical protein
LKETLTPIQQSRAEFFLPDTMALPLFLSLHIGIAVLVFALTAGAFLYNLLEARPQKGPKKDGLYEDKDGRATEETQKAYSVKLQNGFATAFAAVGFGIGLANAVVVTVKDGESSSIDGWLQFLPWVSAAISDVKFHNVEGRLA